NGNLEMVRTLIEAGADINEKNGGDNFSTPLMFAVYLGGTRDRTEIIKLLLESGADVNRRNNSGKTALMYAACVGNTKAIELLIAHGTEPNLKDYDGYNALQHAKRGCYKFIGKETGARITNTINLLLKLGSIPDATEVQ